MEIVLTFEGSPLTMNQERSASHWEVKRRREATRLKAALDGRNHKPQWNYPVTVIVVDFYGSRKRDTLAVASEVKGLIDGLGPELVRKPTEKTKGSVSPGARWWPNDTPEYVGRYIFEPPQKSPDGKDRIELRISDEQYA